VDRHLVLVPLVSHCCTSLSLTMGAGCLRSLLATGEILSCSHFQSSCCILAVVIAAHDVWVHAGDWMGYNE
jgi:hypothetical protein